MRLAFSCIIAHINIIRRGKMGGTAEDVRQEVSKSYGEAISRPVAGGCCDAANSARKDLAINLAGYSTQELADLPPEAADNVFGCGNPVSFAGMRPGDAVLDLGSGAGSDLFLAAKKVGPTGRVIGVDMTDEMIAKANENIRTGGLPNVEVRKGIIEALPVESASVDWVISNCVINLSPEKEKVFQEIARVLKPGGQMLISDIVTDAALPEEILNDRSLYSACVAGAISEGEYLAGLRSAGLSDVEVRGRLVFDAVQILSAVKVATDEFRLDETWKARTEELAKTVEGKVWSAKVYARKPA
jgi:arsenite methyltransferase